MADFCRWSVSGVLWLAGGSVGCPRTAALDRYGVRMDERDVASMRTEYTRGRLDESIAGTDPVALFDRWLVDAMSVGLPEPNAMALATATTSAVPSVRIVLLKQFDEQGAVFCTNFESRKGHELSQNPRAAATMLWHPIDRQVRMEGTVSRITEEQSDAFFAARPVDSQLSSLASPQSRPVPDRAELERLVEQARAETAGHVVARPAFWGGFRLEITEFEFWQGRPNRLHDRLRFSRTSSGWRRERLAS